MLATRLTRASRSALFERTRNGDQTPPWSCTPVGIRQKIFRRGRQGSVETGHLEDVVPPAFGPFLSCTALQTATASIRAIQWSASSCPEANAAITSNT